MIFKFNGIEISEIISASTQIKSERNLIGSDVVLIPDFTIVLYGEEFNPFKSNSIFYGLNNYLFKDIVIEVIETDVETIKGSINNFNWNEETYQLTLQINPFISKRLNNTFIYYNDNVTPAKALEEVLILNGMKDYIDYPSFNNANIAQLESDLLCNFTITHENNLSVINFINTIGENTGSDIFLSMENKIVFLQYNRNLIPITNNDILENKIINFNINKSLNNIINTFNLETIYGNYQDSKDIGSESIHNFGETSKDLSFGANQYISCKYLEGMIWAGENWVYRNKNPKWIIELTCVDRLDNKNSLLDFFKCSFFNNKVYEMIKIEKNIDQEIISLTGISYE